MHALKDAWVNDVCVKKDDEIIRREKLRVILLFGAFSVRSF